MGMRDAPTLPPTAEETAAVQTFERVIAEEGDFWAIVRHAHKIRVCPKEKRQCSE